MKKFVWFVIVSNLLVFILLSCESSENDDFQLPVIDREMSSFNDGDTFYMNARRVNEFSVGLSDNKQLSTFKLHFKCIAGIDTFGYVIDDEGAVTNTIDTIAMFDRVYTFGLLGETNVLLTDSFSIPVTYYYRSIHYPVKPGKLYELTVGCIDLAGNYDSIVYKDITVLYTDTTRLD